MYLTYAFQSSHKSLRWYIQYGYVLGKVCFTLNVPSKIVAQWGHVFLMQEITDRAVVVVKWSACSPSTIRVWIRMKPKVFSVKLVLEKTKNKRTEAGVGPLFLKKRNQRYKWPPPPIFWKPCFPLQYFDLTSFCLRARPIAQNVPKSKFIPYHLLLLEWGQSKLASSYAYNNFCDHERPCAI